LKKKRKDLKESIVRDQQESRKLLLSPPPSQVFITQSSPDVPPSPKSYGTSGLISRLIEARTEAVTPPMTLLNQMLDAIEENDTVERSLRHKYGLHSLN
jgi:hypothetical protein